MNFFRAGLLSSFFARSSFAPCVCVCRGVTLADSKKRSDEKTKKKKKKSNVSLLRGEPYTKKKKSTSSLFSRRSLFASCCLLSYPGGSSSFSSSLSACSACSSLPFCSFLCVSLDLWRLVCLQSGHLSLESLRTSEEAFRSPRDVSLRWLSSPSSPLEGIAEERRESIPGCCCAWRPACSLSLCLQSWSSFSLSPR